MEILVNKQKVSGDDCRVCIGVLCQFNLSEHSFYRIVESLMLAGF